MPQNILKTGLAWLTDQLQENAADDVRYARGGVSTVVRATYGEKMLKVEDGEGGVRMEWSDLDFCIPTDQLVIAGERILPERGDQIFVSDAEGGPTRIYEVLPLDSAGGDSTHRLIHLGAMVRVHTKFVEEEPEC